jgi:hypothetical protein
MGGLRSIPSTTGKKEKKGREKRTKENYYLSL